MSARSNRANPNALAGLNTIQQVANSTDRTYQAGHQSNAAVAESNSEISAHAASSNRSNQQAAKNVTLAAMHADGVADENPPVLIRRDDRDGGTHRNWDGRAGGDQRDDRDRRW